MTSIPNEIDRRAAYTAGLRKLADVMPYEGSSPERGRITFHFLCVDDPRAEMAAARRALGVPMEKVALSDDQYFDLKGNLHGLYFDLTAFRKDVCEQVVTGTRQVEVEEPDPKAVEEAIAALPKTKRIEVVEDFEWRCTPLLAADEPAEAAR